MSSDRINLRRKLSRDASTHDVTRWSLTMDDLLDRFAANRWMPPALTVGALALLLFGPVQGLWRLIAAPAPAVDSAPIARAELSVDLQPLLSANLFGRPARGVSRAPDPGHLPLSSLNLVLTGVMAKARASVALLSVDGAPEEPVTVGEEVTSGAFLDAVYHDRIVLRRDGAHEMVVLRDSSELAPGSPPPGAMMSLGNVGALRSQMPGAARNYAARVSGVQLPTPAPRPRADTGFVVQQVQPGSAYEQLGLRPGDVVRRVNGQLVNSGEVLLKRFGNSNSMTVEVVRNGKTEMLSYSAPDRR